MTTEYVDAFPLLSIWQFGDSKFQVISIRSAWKENKADIDFVRVL